MLVSLCSAGNVKNFQWEWGNTTSEFLTLLMQTSKDLHMSSSTKYLVCWWPKYIWFTPAVRNSCSFVLQKNFQGCLLAFSPGSPNESETQEKIRNLNKNTREERKKKFKMKKKNKRIFSSVNNLEKIHF